MVASTSSDIIVIFLLHVGCAAVVAADAAWFWLQDVHL